ncbi:centrosome-associated protein Alms1a-like [Hetaerina americana]|uniref:centrosome-associated protein Alms1a-like n=1 Tax=Hetaerina americana TaxID=62018 RepID=UPI003A7F2CD4
MSKHINSRRYAEHEDLANEVKQYLQLSDNSSCILKYMSDVVEETTPSPESGNTVQGTVESLNKSSNYQDGRAPSPASISSLTSSRRLEWDSGADVGYHPSNIVQTTLLSTLERMALDGCTESLIRTDPEGTNSCKATKRSPLHKSVVIPDLPTVLNVKRATISVSSPREVAGVINLSVCANNEAVSLKSGGSKTSPENGSRKASVAAAEPDDTEVGASLNVNSEKDDNSHLKDRFQPVYSPVGDNVNSEKCVPLALLASTMAGNSASSSSLASTIVPHKGSDSLLPLVERVITRGVQVGGTLRKGVCSSETSSVKNYSCSEEEIKGLTLNDSPPELCKGQLAKKTGRESFETSSFDCAHSFEYLPGEVYDQKDSVKRTMKEGVESNDRPAEKVKTSLSKDLERNIGQIREILSQKKTNNAERKALIKLLVERIVGSEYLDDEEKNSSGKSSIRVGNSSPIGKEQTENLKAGSQESVDVVSEKSFVPYRPVPGGRLYHVASQAKAKKDRDSSSSSYGSDDYKPTTFYLPVDRVKITQQSSLSSEKGTSSPGCTHCTRKRDSELKHQRGVSKTVVNSCGQAFVSNTKCDMDDGKSCCSKDYHSRRNWWSPVTKSERKHEAAGFKSRQNPVLTYVENERSNQLHWINNEIKHLKNLAQLLEDCSATKLNSPAFLEEQAQSILSSINKKDAKNVANASDKFISSNRSTPLEEPITATMRWHSGLPKKKPLRPVTPPSHDTSEDMHFPERGGIHSSTHSESRSFPSRSSSRNMTNSERGDLPKLHGRKQDGKHSEAYVIMFEDGSPDKKGNSPRPTDRKPLKEVRLKVPMKPGRSVKQAFDTHCWTSLQEQLESHHPHFIKSAEERQKCLEELAHLRSLRQMTRRKLLHYTLGAWEDRLHCKQSNQNQNSLKARQGLPEPVIKASSKVKENVQKPCPRFKRKHRVLPETQKKEAERIKKQSLQTNRIMADIFSRRLQKKVLSGAVSLSTSVSVISSL